ncbi:MAG: phosphoglycerate kinase [Rhodovulum sp.]|nr:phosphoglycerate kinase [Rhodovulum sp.]
MSITAITDMDVAGKTLVVRADLNVPLQYGKVSDATRITRFAAGMLPLLERGARLVILSHLGRPKGELNPAFSLIQVRDALAQALGRDVAFCETSAGPTAEHAARALTDGQVLLCENLRFEPGEERNDMTLARQLAALGDIYVNDAFSCAHRAHASTAAIATLMPAAAGPLLIEELEALRAALDAPKRPSVAIVGGAKVSTKIAVLEHLVTRLQGVIIGGGMANTFLYAKGAAMGKSLCETDQIDTVHRILDLAKQHGCAVHLPDDVVIAHEFAAGAAHEVVPWDACPPDAMILDAGPKSVAGFEGVIAGAKTVLWNGPLGAFEIPPFDTGTVRLARTAAELTRAGLCTSVAGGGDTVAALNAAGATESFSYVSTAGGAFLEWLEGRVLPGIAALERAQEAA